MFIPAPIPPIKKIPLDYLNKFFKYASSLGEEGINRLMKLVKEHGEIDKDYFTIQSIFSEGEKDQLYKQGFKQNDIKDSQRVFRQLFVNDYSTLNKMLYVDNKTFLLQLLLKADKMTMAHSIESRVPFLDKDVVEYAAQLPIKYKLKNFNEKYILKRIAKDLLPKQVAKRKKQRFFVPIHHWFEKDIKNHFFDCYSRERVKERNMFGYDYIRKIEQKYNQSPLYYGRQMWNLLILDKWFDNFGEIFEV